MDKQLAKDIMMSIGHEYGYEVYNGGSEIQIYFDRTRHGIAYQIKDSTHSKAREGNWLQVHQWEDEINDFGPALHSLRSMGDAIAFTQTLITFASIKSKRQ
ncbi:hypothetical protein HJ105_10720 [Vibrio parahaemolyticus]|uniref:hypothetical protein n=2 Tax=Vibrio parahaemolyticus TaxID=670 RepID=UPI00186A8798|nr:hypothetical protein [Vibrio parahaemolyticus]EHR5764767.1 hypothetical protein [Vibrio parahaemolyticus]EHY0932728.1 hypothetical protein [Vibrio parahaemolyticus]MBE4127300.1 hypothetical protein [Vibrio parahaemolyticus]MDF4876387.1 hypothetical protein [Vibrio parahaemolyticus]